jgi:hypothetical protein
MTHKYPNANARYSADPDVRLRQAAVQPWSSQVWLKGYRNRCGQPSAALAARRVIICSAFAVPL